MTDIFNVIAARDARPAAKRFRKVTRYLLRGSKSSKRLYTRKQAARAVRLANRWGLDLYSSPIQTTVEVK